MTATITAESFPHAKADFASLYEPVRPYLGALDRFLEEQIEELEPEIRPLAHYALRSSGKRLRSLLLFYSGWNESPRPGDPLVRAAAVVELVHLATLVHDDILDEADLRHQHPTVSEKFGPSAAVLFGDALFAHALKLAAEFPTVDVCRAVSEATRRVCAGEIKQTFQRGVTTLPLADYFRIIELKTAELFWLSCHLGGFLSGREDGSLRALEKYGRHLGVAYQIFDDVADLLGDESVIGKTLGTDLAKGKFTLPLLLLFQSLAPGEREALVAQLKERLPIAEQDLPSLFRQHRVMELTQEYFLREIHLSNEALENQGDQPFVRKLRMINDLIHDQFQRFAR